MSVLTAIFYTILLLTLIWLTILLTKYLKFYNQMNSLRKPELHPILGHLKFLKETPDKLFKSLRFWSQKYYPYYTLTAPPFTCLNIVSPEDVELITSGMKHTTKSIIYKLITRWLQTGLVLSEGAKWQQRRKLLTPAFHFSILQQFIGVFFRETKGLIEQLNKASEKDFVDVIPIMTLYALTTIKETAMGTKMDMTNKNDRQYKNFIYEYGHLIVRRISRPWHYIQPIYYWLSPSGARERKLIDFLHSYTRKVIQNKLKESKDSQEYSQRKKMAMLDLLVDAQNKGAIDFNGIQEEVDTFMFEGHDTTAVALSCSLLLLAQHEDVQEQIYQEVLEVLPDPQEEPTYQKLHELIYLDRCLKECLRIYPSVPFISRILDEDCQMSQNEIIEKGTMINIHIYDVHRNPKIFPNPEKFDPDRFLHENTQHRHPFAYIPFSAGPRNCIGQKFAMLELKTAISAIIRNFILKPVDVPKDMEFNADMILRPRDGVRIKFVKRN